MRVLLVEDHLSVARVISLMLMTECKAVVDAVDNGEEAIELARHYDYDAIILDLTLPDMQGFEVLRQIRAAGRDTPTLVLSGLTGPEVKVRALKSGADDVMSKPFDKDELCARLKAIIRRSKGHSQSGLQVGPLTLNLDTHEVSINGKPVHVTGKEYAVLELLALRRGIVLTKEQFLSHLYGGMDEPEIKIIDVFICKLRKKLAQAGAPSLIGTVWGRGYMIRDAARTLAAAAIIEAQPSSSTEFAGSAYADERKLISAWSYVAEGLKGYAIHIVLANNSMALADLPKNRIWPTRQHPGLHVSSRICAENSIKHRLTKPYYRWANRQAERMIRTVGEASLATLSTDGEVLESHSLKARLGEMLLERELLEANVAALRAVAI